MKKKILQLIEQEINNITKLPVKQKAADDYSLGGIAKQQVEQQFQMLNPEQQKRYIEILKRSKELYKKAEELENYVNERWKSRKIATGPWSSRYSEPGTGSGLKKRKMREGFVYYPGILEWTNKILQTDLIKKITDEIAKKDAENALKKRMDKVEDELGKKRIEKTKKSNLDANYYNAVSLYDILYYIKNNYGIGGSTKPQEVKEELRLVKGEPEPEKGPFSSSELQALVNDIKEIEKYAYKGDTEQLEILRLPFNIWLTKYQKEFLINKDNKALLDAMVANNDGQPVTKEVLKNFIMAGPPLDDAAPYDSSRLLMRHKTILDIMGIDPQKLEPTREEPAVLPFKKSLEESLKLDEQLLKDIIEKAIEEGIGDKLKAAALGATMALSPAAAGAANVDAPGITKQIKQQENTVEQNGEIFIGDKSYKNKVYATSPRFGKIENDKYVKEQLKIINNNNEGKFFYVQGVEFQGGLQAAKVLEMTLDKGEKVYEFQNKDIEFELLQLFDDPAWQSKWKVRYFPNIANPTHAIYKQKINNKAMEEGKLKKEVLREELTKSEIKKLIGDEITAFARRQLKKMVEEELEKALAKTDIKNKVGDISKDILKKLYKDLSLHHTYVIDRVKL